MQDLVLITYAPMPLINVIPKEPTSLDFGPSFHIHPYLVYASNRGSGESANMHWLA